jgi:hypothetical protein
LYSGAPGEAPRRTSKGGETEWINAESIDIRAGETKVFTLWGDKDSYSIKVAYEGISDNTHILHIEVTGEKTGTDSRTVEIPVTYSSLSYYVGIKVGINISSSPKWVQVHIDEVFENLDHVVGAGSIRPFTYRQILLEEIRERDVLDPDIEIPPEIWNDIDDGRVEGHEDYIRETFFENDPYVNYPDFSDYWNTTLLFIDAWTSYGHPA